MGDRSRKSGGQADGWLGNEEAFSAFYRSNARTLVVWFTRRVSDVETALDLTAESFAQAFKARRSFRGDTPAAASAWLFTIAARQLAGYLRRGYADRSLLKRLAIDVPAATPAEQERILEAAGFDDLRGAIVTAVLDLPVDQQHALQLRVVQELPFAAVADRLAISEPAARMRVSRALARLAEVVEPVYLAREDER
jgi:RNA polymerase sigma-70 factor, ECF subfamily